MGVRDVPVWIYALVDPRDDVVRYVGQTINPKARFASHTSRAAKRLVCEWVESLRAAGVEPRMDILCIIPTEDDEPDVMERFFIRMHEKTSFNQPLSTTKPKEWWSRPGEEPAQVPYYVRDWVNHIGFVDRLHVPLFARHPVSLQPLMPTRSGAANE